MLINKKQTDHKNQSHNHKNWKEREGRHKILGSVFLQFADSLVPPIVFRNRSGRTPNETDGREFSFAVGSEFSGFAVLALPEDPVGEGFVVLPSVGHVAVVMYSQLQSFVLK
jgi:hypothetical protein